MSKYSVIYDNFNRHFAVVNEEVIEPLKRYLNITDIITFETEREAFDFLYDLEHPSEAGKAAISDFNHLKKEAREKYDSCIWNSEEQFDYLMYDLSDRCAVSYKNAFASKLESSSYVRRVLWMCIDPYEHDDQFYKSVEIMSAFVISSLNDNPEMALGAILLQFTQMVAPIGLNNQELERVNKLAEICC